MPKHVSVDLFPGVEALTGDPGAAQMFSADAVYGRGGLTLHALRREVESLLGYDVASARFLASPAMLGGTLSGPNSTVRRLPSERRVSSVPRSSAITRLRGYFVGRPG